MPTMSLRQELDLGDDVAPLSVATLAHEREVQSVRQLVADRRIADHHRRWYGNLGHFGKPVGTVTEVEGGYRREFEAGALQVMETDGLRPSAVAQWAPLVEYVGLRCNEPNESSDEPYVIFSVIALNPEFDAVDKLLTVKKIGPIPNVVDGEVVPDVLTVWDGISGGNGLKIAIGVFEEDEGDPEDVRAKIEEKLREYAKQGAAAIAQAYGAGAAQGEQVAENEAFNWGLRLLSLGLVDLLGLGDDEIGSVNVEVPLSRIQKVDNEHVEAFHQSLQRTTEGVVYTDKVDVSSDEGGYSVYFRIRSRKIGPIDTVPPLP